MELLFFVVFQLLISSIIGVQLINLPRRDKRQASLWCSDNTQAVSLSRNGVCGMGYRYDPTTRYCCVGISMPVCPNGVAASSLCVANRYCGNGLTCQSLITSTGTTTNVCCNSGVITTITPSRGNACQPPNENIGPCILATSCPAGYQCINVNNAFSCCGPPQRFQYGK